MKLDPQLWGELEQHGVTVAHLDMLCALLRMQKNGSVAWHFVHGQLSQCDLRLTFASRVYEVQRVSDALVKDGSSLLR